MTGTRRRSISSKASSHETSTWAPSRFIRGRRRRSGSSCSCLSVEPFGQMNPWLNTSSRSPRMRTISLPRNVISSPQVASQKGQVRNAVRVGDSVMPPACPIRSPCCQDRCAMRRLLPDPRDPVDVAESYDDSTRAPHDGRPWLYLCMIASADGATAVDGRSGTLGGAGDRAVFNTLRGHADLVLVGAGTVRA